jgi:DNA repair protein SbcC/Rad50
MSYIKSVHISGHQSHKNTVIEFTEGLNIIVGDSGSGKSTILRAINFLLFNKPWGKKFINRDMDCCTVEMIYNNGIDHKIVRTRSYSEDKNDLIIDGKEYCNIGRGLLNELVQLTKLDKDKQDILYSNSLNEWGILKVSGTERAKQLVAFSDIIVFDRTLKKVDKEFKRSTDLIALCLSKEQETQEDIDKVGNIESYEEKLNSIKRLQFICEHLQVVPIILKESSTLNSKLFHVSKKLRAIGTKLETIEKVLKLIKRVQQYREYKQEQFRLRNRLSYITYNNTIIETKLNDLRSEFDTYILLKSYKINTQTKNNLLNKIIRVFRTHEKCINAVVVSKRIKALNDYFCSRVNQQMLADNLWEIREEIKYKQNEIDAIGICPVCERVL